MNIITISGPHGAGKDEIFKRINVRLEQEYPGLIKPALYTTTRKPRENEVEGKDILFSSPEEFEALEKEGKLAYMAKIGDYKVGTTFDELRKHKNVIVNVTDKIARDLKEKTRNEEGSAFTIYVYAPVSERRQRIHLREGILLPEIVDWKMDHDPTGSSPEEHADFDLVMENPEGELEKTTEKIYGEVKKFIESKINK